MLGRCVVRTEVEERDKVREELSGVKAWLVTAEDLLSQLEQCPNTHKLHVGNPLSHNTLTSHSVDKTMYLYTQSVVI